MIRAGGVTGRRANALVAFLDQLFIAERLVRRVAPQLSAYEVMQVFRKGLGEAVWDSPTETEAFAAWGRAEIEQAITDYEQNLAKGEVLRWRDDKGNIFLGNDLEEEATEWAR